MIKITKEEHSKETNATDDYGKTFDAGVNHLEGIFFERLSGHDKVFRLDKKIAFFYKESVAYPFVQLTPTKKGFSLTDDEHQIVPTYVEQSYHQSLF